MNTVWVVRDAGVADTLRDVCRYISIAVDERYGWGAGRTVGLLSRNETWYRFEDAEVAHADAAARLANRDELNGRQAEKAW